MTQTRSILPILLPAARPEEADAFLFLDGKPAYGCLLSDDALQIFQSEDAQRKFQERHGQMANSYWAGIKALMSLVQAIEKPDPRILKDYTGWQAVAEVNAEKEMAEYIVGAFKSPEAREILSAIPRTVKKLKQLTYSEEKSKLERRVLKGSPLTAVSELLLRINRLVRKARFVMFFDRSKGRPLPGVYCPDLGTGLAAMIFSHVLTPTGLGVCRRPACGQSFLRIRALQQYCSLQCGNADRKARQRTRSKRR